MIGGVLMIAFVFCAMHPEWTGKQCARIVKAYRKAMRDE